LKPSPDSTTGLVHRGPSPSAPRVPVGIFFPLNRMRDRPMLFELERRLDGSRDLASTRLAKALSPGGKYEPFKRAFDIVAALALLVLASPLLLAIVALVKLTSRGPAIYHQARLGRNGRPFTMLKLRTMTHDCERTTGPVWSTENDPRVTRPGRFLRRAHLDE